MISEILEPTAAIMSDIIIKLGYFGIFLVAFIENIIAPIPSEFVFPWAGFLASRGDMNIVLISLAGALGSVAAALILYYLGYKSSGEGPRKFIDKYGKYFFMNNAELDKAQEWFRKYGIWAVLLFRMMPIGRTIISIPAGFIKMNIWTFTFLTFIGTFVWCFILTYAGYVLGENWESIRDITKGYEHAVLYACIVAVVLFLYVKRKDIPFIGENFRNQQNNQNKSE